METKALDVLNNKHSAFTELELCIVMAGTLCSPEMAADELASLKSENVRLQAELTASENVGIQAIHDLHAAEQDNAAQSAQLEELRARVDEYREFLGEAATIAEIFGGERAAIGIRAFLAQKEVK
jgi:hypothetical protein